MVAATELALDFGDLLLDLLALGFVAHEGGFKQGGIDLSEHYSSLSVVQRESKPARTSSDKSYHRIFAPLPKPSCAKYPLKPNSWVCDIVRLAAEPEPKSWFDTVRPWLDRTLELLEVFTVLIVVVAIGVAALYTAYWVYFDQPSLRQSRLSAAVKSLNDNWRVGLILAIPLFYRTIRGILERLEEFGGAKMSPRMHQDQTVWLPFSGEWYLIISNPSKTEEAEVDYEVSY